MRTDQGRRPPRARLARWLLRRTGFRLVGDMPARGLLVGAPHTSNWDLALAILVFWAHDVTPRVLVKSEVFWWPLGAVLRRLGAIPTDRSGGSGLVARLIEAAHQDERFVVALAPDGTRRAADHWKSGFYRLALATGMPVTCAFVDGPTRTVGTGPTFTMTGDVVADMHAIRAFFADKRGLRPGRGSAVRLRAEDAAGPTG
ncbi:1-acyl-sn-glycerol-3-phosphate acyltransferase [Isoptericola sp. b441]|uniref:1-acyl-sn-glycerol-3-phosphate acyltransferase n=1 Tax=Actinotalea lenta TaxID=3064654 RepID=A0ABT9D6P7_9CELL|nr:MULTISPECIES: 1-acyl-sn-glycerol-3-phosphate acyltransferase [unclassified Isoptericola]MDO8106501.1 1-acyl-sn-glycerol-3-phosphate acyltransferase [Isoptericola sp. b441]MDO8121783.1 1-acyl-sn-glycerol-3-phosphate acyltransferase [Isoptericola sp. b490]